MIGLSMDAELDGFRLYLQRQNLNPRTIQQQRLRLRILLQACIPFDSQTFADFLSSHATKNSPASLNKYVQTARSYVNWRKLDFDQELLKKFRETPKTRVMMSDNEITSFLALPYEPQNRQYAKFNDHYNMMTVFWYLCAFTGAREGEIAALQQHHIDLAGQVMVIEHSKTGTGRNIWLSEMVYPVIEKYLKTLQTDLLFPRMSNTERPIDADIWGRDFRQRISRLGITKKVLPYSLRHSCLTRLGNNGVELQHLMGIAGHTNPKNTMIYVKSGLKAQAEAFRKDPIMRSKIGGQGLIKQAMDFIDRLELHTSKDIEYSKILEAKKVLWDALILEKNN